MFNFYILYNELWASLYERSNENSSITLHKAKTILSTVFVQRALEIKITKHHLIFFPNAVYKLSYPEDERPIPKYLLEP